MGRGDLAVAILILVLSSSSGHADEVTPAKRLYDQGVAEYNLGHYQEALTAFENAYRLRHDAALLYNVAQCQRQLRRSEDAERSYRAYLRESPDVPLALHEQVQKLISAMHSEAQAQRASAQPSAKTTTVATPPQADTAVLTTRTPPPSRATDQQSHGKRLHVAGIATGSVGLALLVAGGIFAGLSKSAGDIAYGSAVYDPAADDRQKSYRTVDIVCFAVGGAAVAAGVTIYTLGAIKR